MKIIYKDGGVLTVNSIKVYEEGTLYCDDLYTVSIRDVDSIEEDEEED